ncbi:MAG: stress protein, tellurium resistance TerD [Candidatus Peregrinibacteria bacterium GW2011_GWF2_43_17]|nr:MAG: stress protein, tellurium resistance TerD [Candidatus Peregrinibacteria bacterium GW2011_GWF2_43_17]KKT19431.1 MAG: hypothetical protein UW03_C0018G0010 [Candidatus Peregrinibacteria bacterium GW2011_GWA2_43_8]HAU40115.1 hypothetical protein [Candidatus Peregrinibacteria bacterium]
MLTSSKKKKLLSALRSYHKKYLSDKFADLDESGTRLMINMFLTDILGYASIEEIKTEYMIRGTYADYVIQVKGERSFLVEVKAFSLNLSDKHLRQATNYGANEGIEWTLLTNGRNFDFYKIIFNKPIEIKKVFSIDLNDHLKLKEYAEVLQYLHRDFAPRKGLHNLWNRYLALEPSGICKFLYAKPVINFLKRGLKRKFKTKFESEEIVAALKKMLEKD